jgi:hypothetical protein
MALHVNCVRLALLCSARQGAAHKLCALCPAVQRDKFEDMLRRLSAERADICTAMAFAMDNAESGACCCCSRLLLHCPASVHSEAGHLL